MKNIFCLFEIGFTQAEGQGKRSLGVVAAQLVFLAARDTSSYYKGFEIPFSRQASFSAA